MRGQQAGAPPPPRHPQNGQWQKHCPAECTGPWPSVVGPSASAAEHAWSPGARCSCRISDIGVCTESNPGLRAGARRSLACRHCSRVTASAARPVGKFGGHHLPGHVITLIKALMSPGQVPGKANCEAGVVGHRLQRVNRSAVTLPCPGVSLLPPGRVGRCTDPHPPRDGAPAPHRALCPSAVLLWAKEFHSKGDLCVSLLLYPEASTDLSRVTQGKWGIFSQGPSQLLYQVSLGQCIS